MMHRRNAKKKKEFDERSGWVNSKLLLKQPAKGLFVLVLTFETTQADGALNDVVVSPQVTQAP